MVYFVIIDPQFCKIKFHDNVLSIIMYWKITTLLQITTKKYYSTMVAIVKVLNMLFNIIFNE